jgi:hypothetical protein
MGGRSPGIFLAINLLTASDLRYWPKQVPITYAPFAGAVLLLICVWTGWVALKDKKPKKA